LKLNIIKADHKFFKTNSPYFYKNSMDSNNHIVFNYFNSETTGIELPKKFTFPFYYEPHLLATIACKELQNHIINQKEWAHNFGLPENDLTLQNGVAIGKMFGVLVVQSPQGDIGYLAAFSGKLADSNHHKMFVPPVYDMLKEGDFFLKGGVEIIAINKKVETLENNENYLQILNKYEACSSEASDDIASKKKALRENKKKRKVIREKGRIELSDLDFIELQEKLKDESLKYQYFFRKNEKMWDEKLTVLKEHLTPFSKEINELKEERKAKSNSLQNRLFSEYKFLNQKGETQSLTNIFDETVLKKPPAGAGECAAPKLLQHAFLNNLKPIALAEFWWGESPPAEVKKHLQYYPACKGKCEPILHHMLADIEVDENLLLVNLGKEKEIEILHEDEDLVVINKPAELLSVPGKSITDSVYTRMQVKYPNASGPLIVHRLDMSTSGIMVIPLNKKTYGFLQKQFINRLINKKYVALLDGIVPSNNGTIDLPLRGDLNDRPKQLVCFEHGKASQTKYKVVERLNNKTRINFYPLTGRTHQLRVHASHFKGLNIPIVGDDLYGNRSSRLHLHAESIEFVHPTTREKMKIRCKEEF
jgi:tRNA pseudouridine32 synthase/23S rRNA pseudouridine746 synthase